MWQSKMKNILLSVFIAFTLLSCNRKNESVDEKIVINETRPISELKNLVLSCGDTLAYKELEIAFIHEKWPGELLLYSIYMANKYQFPRAYFDVYYYTFNTYMDSLGIIDDDANKLAIEYLKKGAELKDPQSIRELGLLYIDGKYIEKDSIKGKKLEKLGRKLCGF